MNHDEIIKYLKTQSSKTYKKNVVRMGIPEECSLGVSLTVIKKLAVQITKSNALAYELWNDGYHETKLLAVLLWQYKELNFDDVDKLMSEVKSWDLCNHLCKHLIAKMDNYEDFIFEWIESNEIYKKRAAFILIGTSIIKHKQMNEEVIDTYLKLIADHCEAEHEHIKKGVSYALKEIGKKNFKYNEKAILLAYEMLENGSQAQRWIARDVLKELENMVKADGRERLIAAHTKMGNKYES